MTCQSQAAKGLFSELSSADLSRRLSSVCRARSYYRCLPPQVLVGNINELSKCTEWFFLSTATGINESVLPANAKPATVYCSADSFRREEIQRTSFFLLNTVHTWSRALYCIGWMDGRMRLMHSMFSKKKKNRHSRPCTQCSARAFTERERERETIPLPELFSSLFFRLFPPRNPTGRKDSVRNDGTERNNLT